jgi:DNA-binding CsgD family transcriptional regulator
MLLEAIDPSLPETDGVSPLIGRKRELDALHVLLAKLVDRGGALLLRGDVGVGKSALLLAARDRAEQDGARVLSVSAVRSEMRVDFAGLHQILQPLLARADDLPGPQRDALLSTFGMREGRPGDLFLVALAALELVAAEARRNPVLIAIDDAHWLDPPTVDILAFVARRLGRQPVLLLGAIRDGYESALFDLRLPELRVDRLDVESSNDLLDATAPGLDGARRRRILEAAGGNPLALFELSEASGSPPPSVFGRSDELPISRRLAHALLERFSDLPKATRAMLLIASADEQASMSDLLTATARFHGQAPVSLNDLGPAEDLALVRHDGERVMFCQALLPVAIYQAATPVDRCRAHAALAATMVHSPGRHAWHRAASISSPDGNAAAELDRAVSTCPTLAPRVMLRALERAAELTPDTSGRNTRRLRAAELAVEVGEHQRARELLAQIEPAEVNALDRVRILLVRRMVGPAVPPDARSVDRLVDAAAYAADAGQVALARRTLEEAAIQSWWTDPGLDTRQRTAREAERVGANGDARVLSTLALADPAHHAAALQQRALCIGPDSYDPKTACHLGTALHQTGALGIATTFLTAAVPRLRDQGWLLLLPQALAQQAWGALHRGDWELAAAAAEEAETLARQTHQPLWLAAAQTVTAMMAAIRGDDSFAKVLLGQAEALALPMAASPVLSDIQTTRALIALGRACYDEAFEHLHRTFDPSDPAHHHFCSWRQIGNYVEAAVHAGRLDDVRGTLARAESLASSSQSPQLQVALLYARSLLPGDHTAEARFDAALATDLTKWPLYRARLLLEYGTWLRRHRKISEARPPLRAAQDAFDALGAAPWAGRAQQELRASRETQHRKHEVWTELTEQERQIAALAAQGLSNRQIAERLYISHRTVGSHLYRIFPKLGVVSRAQLQTAMRSDRLAAAV